MIYANNFVLSFNIINLIDYLSLRKSAHYIWYDCHVSKVLCVESNSQYIYRMFFSRKINVVPSTR